ncbi:MAG: hypothetical protein IJO32_08070 [Bacilli bacterium]|nr:hypothetical protein [Bacilli bacterium]
MSKGEKKKKKFKFFNIFIFLIVILGGFYLIYFGINKGVKVSNKVKTYYLSSNIKTVNVYDENFNIVDSLTRGEKVELNDSEEIKDTNGNIYKKIKYNDKVYIVSKDSLKESNKNIASEEKIYVRTSTSIYSDNTSGKIIGLAKKGDELEVLGYNKIENGIVDSYKIKIDDITGYVYGKYMVFDKDSALAYYESEKYHDLHSTRGDSLGAGNAGNLDYYPVEKPIFENNKMPDVVYSLYLNGGKDVISKVDEYIEFAKTTNINAFVVDIKDNEAPAYDSEVMREYSPTNFAKASNSMENYKVAIQKIKDAGFYVIGRITVFKDKYYATDHPESAIMDTRTGGPYLHSNTYWPSPFKRDVWMFNVELAKEAVKEMGFNEIQFDYVRFPDRVLEYERQGLMDFRNDYEEEKAQAIQRFLMYACDELHKLNVYVSADVFGESAHKYVTAYGQYWSAITNVVDVISAMPYPDHFSKYEYGFKEVVWTKPYELLTFWSNTYVVPRQSEAPTPAIVRTWIQTYDVRKSPSVVYGAEMVDAQIRALFDTGLTGGYMTWNSSSNLEKYKSQITTYQKEYK